MTTTTRPVIVSPNLIVGPTREPLDLEETKKVLRIKTTSEDTIVDLGIAWARQKFEEVTGVQLMKATWEYRLEAFPYPNTALPYPTDIVELPYPPLLALSSVAYSVSGSPDETQLTENTDYVVETSTGPYPTPGLIRPLSGGSWPTVSLGVGSVRIRYTAGFGTTPGAIPELVRGVLYWLVGHYYRFRAESYVTERGGIEMVPMGATEIMTTYKRYALPQHPRPSVLWP